MNAFTHPQVQIGQERWVVRNVFSREQLYLRLCLQEETVLLVQTLTTPAKEIRNRVRAHYQRKINLSI